LNKLGFPSDTEQQALAGQFVEVALGTSSERDLNVGIAFLVKQPPEKLARTVLKEMLLSRVDPDTIAYARFDGEGALAQLAGLKLTPTQLKAYANAQPGDDLNLSSTPFAPLALSRHLAAKRQVEWNDRRALSLLDVWPDRGNAAATLAGHSQRPGLGPLHGQICIRRMPPPYAEPLGAAVR
jgi:hypothetical protein